MSEPKAPVQQPNPSPTTHPEAKPPTGKDKVPDDSSSEVGLIGRPDQRGADDKDGNAGLANPSPKP